MKHRVISNQYKIKHLNKQFYNHVGYPLNIKDPKTFNEKIQWLKLYYQDPLVTKCADKYSVREYVASVAGDDILVNLLDVYEDVNDIDFDKLPKKFALKVNNGSGKNIICRNKSKLNIEETKQQLIEWTKPSSNHYYFSFEWCYKNIRPKIVAEEYIDALDGDLKDYKFLCFDGKVEMLFVCSERSSGALKVDFFDTSWSKLPFTRHYENSTKEIPRPKHFKQMLEIAEKLAKPFPFVRVDLYEAKDKVMFSELTFYPGSGLERFTPTEWDYKLGELINLPQKNILSWPLEIIPLAT